MQASYLVEKFLPTLIGLGTHLIRTRLTVRTQLCKSALEFQIMNPNETAFPRNQILHGDCTTLMQEFPEECIDLTVTSPPYDKLRIYGGHGFEPEPVIEQLWRITKPGGLVVWVVQDSVGDDGSLTMSSYQHALIFGLEGWRLHDEITLVRNGRRNPMGLRYGPCEKAYVFSKGNPKTINRLRDRKNSTAGAKLRGHVRHGDTPVTFVTGQITAEYGFRFGWWQYSVGGRPKDVIGDHPARMGERIAKDFILGYSNPGDLVFDPMSGSGTTCKMAYLKRRLYLGTEIHEPYVLIARERLRLARRQRKAKVLDSCSD